jgi:hypothetical protein
MDRSAEQHHSFVYAVYITCAVSLHLLREMDKHRELVRKQRASEQRCRGVGWPAGRLTGVIHQQLSDLGLAAATKQ